MKKTTKPHRVETLSHTAHEWRELLAISRNEHDDIVFHLDGGEEWQFTPDFDVQKTPPVESVLGLFNVERNKCVMHLGGGDDNLMMDTGLWRVRQSTPQPGPGRKKKQAEIDRVIMQEWNAGNWRGDKPALALYLREKHGISTTADQITKVIDRSRPKPQKRGQSLP